MRLNAAMLVVAVAIALWSQPGDWFRRPWSNAYNPAISKSLEQPALYLLLDKPLAFGGTLDIRASEGSGSYGPQSVLLKGLTASSFGFDDATHRMTLFGGGAVLDTVQFTPDILSASFKTGPYASLDVLQTAGGVLLRGLYSTSPAGATEIPRHLATV